MCGFYIHFGTPPLGCYSEYLYRYSYSKEVVDIGQSIDKLQSDVDLIKRSKYGKKSGLKNNVFENF